MFPRLAALIAQERRRAPNALLVDTGDIALDGETADLGARLLAGLNYDALTPGNAENDTLVLRTHLGRLGAPVVVANLPPDAFGYPTEPYRIVERGNTRIGLLGLTTPPVYLVGHPLHRPKAQEVPVADADAAARHWVPYLREQVDLVVVLSHLGLWHDTELARAVPGIDLIVGGHSHHRLQAPVRIGTTAIVQAGIGGAYLGVLQIERESQGWHIDGHLVPVWTAAEEDAEVAQIVRDELQQHLPHLLQPLGETPGCWADPWQENGWANFIIDDVRTQAAADIGWFKSTMFWPALDQGPVNGWDLLRAMPSLRADESMEVDDIVRMVLPGTAIRAICEHSVADLPYERDPAIPLSFCLPGNTHLYSSGLRVTYDLAQPQGTRVCTLLVNGADLDPQRRYSVVVPGFLAKGYSGYTWFRDGDERYVVGKERPMLLAALARCRQLPPLDGRQ